MKKTQWIFFGIALLIAAALYAASEKQFFGAPKIRKPQIETANQSQFSTDSVLHHAKQHLTAAQTTRISFLEHSISRGDVKEQQLHIYHQLAAFWRDTAKSFNPFAWYTAEAARLENSEKSLTFAARLFLEGLKNEENPQLKQWEAVQAKDLFERSLKINPANDSSKVNLGAVYLYGGLASPMEGINIIREVVEKDPTNIHAQMTLGEASLVSGQLDKAAERFITVVQMQPDNLEAIFRVAEIKEQMHKEDEAIEWYKKSLPFIKIPGLREEVEERISQLKK
jgi:tetratricopeptide (TPR) repeat protein